LIVGCNANNDDDNDENVGDNDDDDDDTAIELMVGTTDTITISFRKYVSNALGQYTDTSANEDNSFRNHIR